MDSGSDTRVIGPGAHILVRDAVWRVVRVEPTSSGRAAWRCIGVSEIVRDQEALFLEEFEDRVQVLDPRTTRLVPDESPRHRAGLLYLESRLREVAPGDEALAVGHRAAMDVMEYQLLPAWMALQQPRPRILVADGVGLGKTIEAGVLLAELIRRGRGRRILVATVRSMLTQFQKELWARFAIPLVRLDSVGLQRVRAQLPTHHNPFYHFDRVIVSIDTLKQYNWFRAHLEQARWDVVVIDEAHNVAARGSTRSQRARLAEILAANTDSLILLSATPHDGRPRSFASLMNLLDPTAIPNPDDYTKEDISGLFVRRFKKDVEAELGRHVPDRRVRAVWSRATETEEAVFEALAGLSFQRLDRRAGPGMLFKTTLLKAAFSSPAACLATVRARLRRIERHEDRAAFAADEAALRELATRLEPLAEDPDQVGKYRKLLEVLKEEWRWTPRRAKRDRVVIFTERRETLNWLAEHLPAEFGLEVGEGKGVRILHGGLSDKDQQDVVEAFGSERDPVRLLLATDVAAEGLNLHYLCHRLVHFDVPWSLMVCQQRNGRIDRYGQKERPEIVYLLTRTRNEAIQGDQRILEILLKKEDQAHRNIGDPADLMKVYDPGDEERITARAIEEGLAPEEFEARLDARIEDPFARLLAEAGAAQASAGVGVEPAPAPGPADNGPPAGPRCRPSGQAWPAVVPKRDPLSLYRSDFHFLAAALRRLQERGEVQDPDLDRGERAADFPAPRDLLRRFDRLPREIRPSDGRVRLTCRPEVMEAVLEDARRREDSWPKVHYFWAVGPVTDWLCDRLREEFGRHEAPVIRVREPFRPGEAVFLVSAVLPNELAEPLLQEWYAVRFLPSSDPKGYTLDRVQAFADFLAEARLDPEGLPNPGTELPLADLQTLVGPAVDEALSRLGSEREGLEARLARLRQERLERLEYLKERRLALVEEQFGGRTDRLAEHARARRRREVERLFADHRRWTEARLTPAAEPFVQVLGVLFRPDDRVASQEVRP